MADKSNVLWEKHRMYLPGMRQKAVHRCRHCKFFVAIKGKLETKYGCVVSIKAYGNLEKRIPPVIPVIEIIKQVGLEGLDKCLKCSDPEAQSCGKFSTK
ncbi:hypothetical protein Psch_03536 [Pelotomaculum schinkii]|uniref:Uncharacterized protein n=1 Tax=Pelotomaculum schinkii TaxID=78350 RepID=A0A4Y7R745_9FIRM|nr:hypothetical protein [Pelotomaculum schinkii]TEB04774.1 hypothetical protein Psch_03536 [Pelotomaculum schinkii]